jgi:predicted NBD/HSP70 family sugar kinase
MVHDGEAAATVELWFSPDIVNAIFVHIRYNMSGALIIGGKFLKGNELKSGVFEHMTIVPGGRPCYCGKQGCVDTYCTLNALLMPGEPVEKFFAALRAGSADEVARWDEYLKYLATAIDNLHMMMDYDVILGGILGRYLAAEDIDRLHRLVSARTAFPTDRRFIRIGATAKIPIAAGAALPHVMHYLGIQSGARAFLRRAHGKTPGAVPLIPGGMRFERMPAPAAPGRFASGPRPVPPL